MPVVKTAEASTLTVVNELKANLGRMQSVLPEDVKLTLEFDQSPYVTGAVGGVVEESALGAILTGLMVLLFLRDWRSVVVVVLTIPLALMGAVFGLWLAGQTINLMTLGGLSLAVGILVDEATVVIENIHTQMARTDSIAPRRSRTARRRPSVPNMLAMLCILAVFLPSFMMEGAARGLFVPLALARRLRHDVCLRAVDHLRARAVDLAVAALMHTRATARTDIARSSGRKTGSSIAFVLRLATEPLRDRHCAATGLSLGADPGVR